MQTDRPKHVDAYLNSIKHIYSCLTGDYLFIFNEKYATVKGNIQTYEVHVTGEWRKFYDMVSHNFYSSETIIIFMVVSVYRMCFPTLRKNT
jgi:hypothetical protein